MRHLLRALTHCHAEMDHATQCAVATVLGLALGVVLALAWAAYLVA